MTPRTQWFLAGVAAGLVVAALVAGALALRERLVADLSQLVLEPARARLVAAGPTATPTPGVLVLPTRPASTATPAPASPQPPAATPTPAGTAVVGLPLVATGPLSSSAPLDLRLTPETRPTAVPTPAATPTPGPTPAPTPTRAPLRATKLGVGLYESGGAFLPVLDQLRPSVILLMDPTVDFAQEVRKLFPKAFIMGRLFEEPQPLDNPGERGRAFADKVAARAVPLRGVVDAWMGYNEVSGHNDYANYRAYNTFQVAFARRLQGDHGIPAVAGNDGPATVEPQDYVKYFAEAIQASKYFGVHTYSPNGENSMRSERSRHMVFRHREIRAALAAAGVKHGPFIITEAGLWDGWRGVTSEESMAEDYIWFAEELNRDDYVLGMTIFGVFLADRWQKFNVYNTSIVPRIGAYNTVGWR